MAPPNAPEGHYPNQTTTDKSHQDPSLPQGTAVLPRDPNQPIHKKPRVFIHRPSEHPEEEVEARKNTSIWQGLKTIELDDFSRLQRTPCFRDAYMPGIAGGVGMGALRFTTSFSMHKAFNWAASSFLAISVGTYWYCQRVRQQEKDGIRQAVAVLDEKRRLKEAEEDHKKEREGQEAERKQQKAWGVRNSLKFW
ncbi:MAG: hypothetical protein M1831_005241 [Alyxoria varia]|nr:MAG: hypothetical protein M1831_005241 [Alyxoria varia]